MSADALFPPNDTRHWDMRDWPPAEITVSGVVAAVEGIGADEDRVAAVDQDGRPLRILGARPAGADPGLVELVIEVPR